MCERVKGECVRERERVCVKGRESEREMKRERVREGV